MNESAFPWQIDNGELMHWNTGMTLRDYFAAKAMPMAVQEMDEIGSTARSDGARIAYEYADAMMKAREL